MVGAGGDGGGEDVDRGPAGNVVDDEGEAEIGHCGEVAYESAGGWFDVRG